MAQVQFQIELPIGPEWHNVELLRTSILNCLATVFQDNAYCHTVAMVTGELLENAVKYGHWSKNGSSAFRLRVLGNPEGVTVEVSNPVDARGDAARRVLETVRFINECGSPAEAYAARIRAIAEQPASQEMGSRLGLVRVAYEGNCTLDAQVDGHVLKVRATSKQR